MKRPKDYRQEIYSYVVGLLGRPLTYEEHDDLHDMMSEYVFSMRNMGATIRRIFCRHDWISDKKIESGQRQRAYVKCLHCDKRSFRKVPTIAFAV